MVEEDEEVTPHDMNSLKKLANANFARFAVQVQHLSAEVQMKIIEQLPEFKKIATEAVEKISKAHESTLDSVQHSEDHAHQDIKEWRGALIAMLDDPNLSLDDKLRITAQIGETVRLDGHPDEKRFERLAPQNRTYDRDPEAAQTPKDANRFATFFFIV